MSDYIMAGWAIRLPFSYYLLPSSKSLLNVRETLDLEVKVVQTWVPCLAP